MKCHICGIDNNKTGCEHYSLNLDNLKKGDWVHIKRQVINECEKKVIFRQIRGVEKDTIWCDDNIDYPKKSILQIH